MAEADWKSDPWADESAARRRWYDLLGRPPGWSFNLMAGLIALLGLVSTASPAWAVLPLLVAAFAGIVLGAVWLVRLWAASLLRRRGTDSRSLTPFAVAPLILMLAVMLVPFDVPIRIGFELSRAQFERRVEEVRPDPAIAQRLEVDRWARRSHFGERIGLYGVEAVSLDGDTVAFETGGGFFLSQGGFAYAPGGEPFADHPYDRDVVALGGGWYSYVLEWD